MTQIKKIFTRVDDKVQVMAKIDMNLNTDPLNAGDLPGPTVRLYERIWRCE